MNPDQQRVADLIRKAFAGVTLGDGVGLLQAQAMDDYGDEDSARARDEKLDWTAIAASQLDACYSSLSFFDAEGMRFHLPAYLIADIGGDLLTADPVFDLTHASGPKSRFHHLNREQRSAVRAFLEFYLSQMEEPLLSFRGPAIQAALDEFWNDDAC